MAIYGYVSMASFFRGIVFFLLPALTYTGACKANSNLERFTKVYQHNLWRGKNSVSGYGSDLWATVSICAWIPRALRAINAKIVLDAPCGDFHWMKEVDLSGVIEYVGADIVPELVKSNQEKFGSEKRCFVQLDLVRDSLPSADVLLCRDFLIHLATDDIIRFITNLKRSDIRYVITNTYKQPTSNTDITQVQLAEKPETGRHVNLEISPYNFPPPLLAIKESYPYRGSISKKQLQKWESMGKYLALWRVDDIPMPDSVT